MSSCASATGHLCSSCTKPMVVAKRSSPVSRQRWLTRRAYSYDSSVYDARVIDDEGSPVSSSPLVAAPRGVCAGDVGDGEGSAGVEELGVFPGEVELRLDARDAVRREGDEFLSEEDLPLLSEVVVVVAGARRPPAEATANRPREGESGHEGLVRTLPLEGRHGRGGVADEDDRLGRLEERGDSVGAAEGVGDDVVGVGGGEHGARVWDGPIRKARRASSQECLSRLSAQCPGRGFVLHGPAQLPHDAGDLR
mmetsp:Transcript_10674/g.32131  ORF Transcript_10674/g.32131 Transcript_10674/m.32131 type:complete len:252 (+) Transcript_10674:324-1079(+)